MCVKPYIFGLVLYPGKWYLWQELIFTVISTIEARAKEERQYFEEY